MNGAVPISDIELYCSVGAFSILLLVCGFTNLVQLAVAGGQKFQFPDASLYY